jgi:ribosomal protein L37E
VSERTTICPQCGELVVQLRNGEDYCEECGWPDENRTEEGGDE